MTLLRRVLRLDVDALRRVDQLVARCLEETGRRPHRSAVMRLLLGRGLDGIDASRPLAEQLPLPRHKSKKMRSRSRSAQPRSQPRVGASMRARIVQTMSARPEEVFTPAKIAPLVGAKTRDRARNTLLALAAQGRIEKLAPGQYRARRQSADVGAAVACGAPGGCA